MSMAISGTRLSMLMAVRFGFETEPMVKSLSSVLFYWILMFTALISPSKIY